MNNDIKTRELTATEIVSYSFRILFGKLKYIILICFFAFLPISLFSSLVSPQLYTTALEQLMNSSFEQSFAINSAAYFDLMKYFLLSTLIGVIFSPLAVGALSYITVQSIEGKPVTLNGIMECSMQKWGRLVYTSIIYNVLYFLGLSFLIVPGIYFYIVYMFCECVAAVSNKYGISALLVSKTLIRGRFFKAVGLLILCFLVRTFILMGLGMFDFGASAIANIITNIIYETLAAFSIISICLFYINAHHNYKNN